MVASRHIAAGEIILTEKPLVYGPKINQEPLCLGCNRKLRLAAGASDLYKCSGCKWPVCGADCERLPAHAAECAVLGRTGLPSQVFGTQATSRYCCITPLRCMLMRDANPKG